MTDNQHKEKSKTTNKKYYWLKLKEDFFETDTIKFIEEMDNGIPYCYFYLKLCLKSLKTNGVLIRAVGELLIPYDEVALAKLTDTPIDTVRCALSILKKFKIISILENGEIFLPQLLTMVGSESSVAERVRKSRERKVLHCNTNVTPLKQLGNSIETQLKQNCNTEKEIELEIEKDKERDNRNKEEFSEFDFSLFMSGTQEVDDKRKAQLIRILTRNLKFAREAKTPYLDFIVSIQEHLHEQFKKGIDIFGAINNSISGGIKTIVAPKNPYTPISIEERKKQQELNQKKEERKNILANYCCNTSYKDAMNELNRDKRDRLRHFPYKPSEVITKAECDQYKINYPTKQQWDIFNNEKEKFLLKVGGFTEVDCK
jgi:predicted phage replisome organizer